MTGIKKDNKVAHAFYAVFTENTYNVKLNTQGGTLYNPIGTKNKYFKGSQVIVKNKKYTDEVADEIRNSTNYRSKKGYAFVGLATDSKGKNLVIDETGQIIATEGGSYSLSAKARGFKVKNNGTLTLYAIWKKISAPAISSVTASYSGDKLTVTSYTENTDMYISGIEIAYSTNILFTPKSTVTKMGYTGATELRPSAGSNFYVKVRSVVRDSAGNEVCSKWSKVVRASKNLSD